MSSRRGSYYRQADFTIEVIVAAQGSKEIDVTVGYYIGDDELTIDYVMYRPNKDDWYSFDWMLADKDFNATLVEAVSQYETDMAEGYRDSEAEAKMEELRERRIDNAA